MKHYILILILFIVGCQPTKVDNNAQVVFSEVNKEVTPVVPKKEVGITPSTKRYSGVGSLAAGILKITGDSWFFCGSKLSGKEASDMAISIAYLVYSNMDSVSLDVSAWGVVGTMFNESRIDSCALGLYPRKWAYSKGFLLRKGPSISHTKYDVLDVVSKKEAKSQFSSFDLGICQVLTRFYKDNPPSDFLDLKKGIRICILEMKARANGYRTKTPWLYWKGHKAEWYRGKIRRAVKKMGATKSMLREI